MTAIDHLDRNFTIIFQVLGYSFSNFNYWLPYTCSSPFEPPEHKRRLPKSCILLVVTATNPRLAVTRWHAVSGDS